MLFAVAGRVTGDGRGAVLTGDFLRDVVVVDLSARRRGTVEPGIRVWRRGEAPRSGGITVARNRGAPVLRDCAVRAVARGNPRGRARPEAGVHHDQVHPEVWSHQVFFRHHDAEGEENFEHRH